MNGDLTRRQKKFLYHYMKSGNISEAAAICGIPPEKAYETAMTVLENPKAEDLAAKYAEIMKRFAVDGVTNTLDRLVGGRINDVVILAKSDLENLSDEEIRKLDLYNVSELKFGKGVCEFKFTDRIKAAEKLSEIRNSRASDSAAQSFFYAIGSAANTAQDGESPPDE